MKIHTYTLKSFTNSPEGGNPAGVVLDARGLTPNQMKQITSYLQVSETAFVFPSHNADMHTRFFSPTTEVDLCGHATIALFHVLGNHQYMQSSGTKLLTQETKAGILPVILSYADGHCTQVMMNQQHPQLEDCTFPLSALSQALGISKHEIDQSLPWQRVSTGLFTLPICVSSLSVLKSIIPKKEKIIQLCKELDVGSLHVYTFETYELNSLYHARNFAPLYGILEDPVTGTANGAVCSYLHAHGRTPGSILLCEQGDILGTPGRVHVKIGEQGVQVGGSAVQIQEEMVNI